MRRLFRKLKNSFANVSFLPPGPAAAGPPPSNATIAPPPPFQILSHEPLIVVSPNFLDDQSCQTIIQAAETLGNRWTSSDTDHDVKYELSSYYSNDDPQSSAQLLESVYGAIDAIVGVPRIPQDVNPKVHHYQAPPSAARAPSNGNRFPSGLHIDTNARPNRYCTAILYLSSLEKEEDGCTVFPAARPLTTATPTHNKVQVAATSLLDNCVLHTNHVDTGDTQVQVLLDAGACQSTVGVSVRPEAGKLLIFFTCQDDGVPDPLSFHGAAKVQPGPEHSQGKFHLQIFKELPQGVNPALFVKEKRDRVKSLCVQLMNQSKEYV